MNGLYHNGQNQNLDVPLIFQLVGWLIAIYIGLWNQKNIILTITKIQYQPSGVGQIAHRLQCMLHKKWPPEGTKIANMVWKGVQS